MELNVLLSLSLLIIISNTVLAEWAHGNFEEACDACKRRLNANSVDCKSLETKFENGRSDGNYDSFLGDAGLGREYSNGMMYSGRFPWANQMTPGWFGHKFTIIHDTLYGCTVSGHEAFTQKTNETQFWQKSSKKFASQLKGSASVYLNGENSEPFNPNSIFAMHEVPNLNKVDQLTAYISEGAGSCNSSSVKELGYMCNNQTIDFRCVDNQEDVRRELCTNNTCVEGKVICPDKKCNAAADKIHTDSLFFVVVFFTTVHLLTKQK